MYIGGSRRTEQDWVYTVHTILYSRMSGGYSKIEITPVSAFAYVLFAETVDLASAKETRSVTETALTSFATLKTKQPQYAAPLPRFTHLNCGFINVQVAVWWFSTQRA